jgi:hypothetical protein
MATYRSDAVVYREAVAGPGTAHNCKVVVFTVACTAAASTSDTLEFGYVPAGARVVLAVLEATDMDTNGSPTITLNIGDAGDADRIFAASTVAQAGTLSTAIATTGAGYLYTSATLITGTAAANATTAAAGSVTLTLFYTFD